MLSFFRSISKSRFGTLFAVVFLVAILGSFAMADISNFGSGNLGIGMGSSTLVEVGDQQVTEREMSDAMQHQLQQARQQNPEADYASIADDIEPLLRSLVDQRTLMAFADKYRFPLSKRLIDAEISQIPSAQGLNGKFSEQAYAGFLSQQRLTDAQVREIIRGGLLQQLMLSPIASDARVPVGVALPYSSMLLESRKGEAAVIPTDSFRSGLKPTDADLQRFYAANRDRYMVPEQRVLRLARIGPEQVASVAASDKEIADYYKSNQATYASKELRSFSQAVVQDQKTAQEIAARARAGVTIAAAAAPAGQKAAVTTLTEKSQADYSSLAGAAMANAAFAAKQGDVVGPVQSQFGWIVLKVDGVKRLGGKSLAEATPEITAKITASKRKDALEDAVSNIEDALDAGNNFAEAAAKAKLQVTETPLITATGSSRSDPAYKFPAELAPALKSGFELAPNDEPVVETLANDQGYVLVAPAQVVAAAPAPLSSIHDKVAGDWIDNRALERAKAVATAIAAKASHGISLEQAVKASGVSLPAVRPMAARRIEIATAKQTIPAPIRMLFTLGEGKSHLVAAPEGAGYFVVKTDKIIPGNAMLQPDLISEIQNEMQQSMSEDYAAQFLSAIRQQMKVERNEKAITDFKKRIVSSGG